MQVIRQHHEGVDPERPFCLGLAYRSAQKIYMPDQNVRPAVG